jgi:CheY-like chemotaxis protein
MERPVTPTPPRHRILLVEDRPGSLRPVGELLERQGYLVEPVDGVLYAMWSVNASHRVYDAVLCAVELTDGDAIDLITHLRQRMGVRTIALAPRGGDPTALRRVNACRAIDRVLTHPGAAPDNPRACETVCDAVAELLSPRDPLRAAAPGFTVHPPNVA